MDLNFERKRYARHVPVLYDPISGSRPLRILFDETSTADWRAGNSEASALLRSLAKAGAIESLNYSDDGPPATALRLPSLHNDGAVAGWALAARVDDPSRPQLSHEVTYAIGDSIRLSAISGDVGRADRVQSDRTYSHLSEEDAARERGLASVAYGTALAVKADLLVTTRPFLTRNLWFSGQGTVSASPEVAIALIGQFLRSRSDFLVRLPNLPSQSVLARTGKGTFYWIAARALLPSGWSWQDQCRVHDEVDGSADLGTLALSVFQRVSRCLVARDSARWLDYMPATNDVIDDLMSTLDVILVNLVGAYDAVARVANKLLAIDARGNQVGWQKSGWLDQVRRRSALLAAIIERGTPEADLFEVLRLLRNTVHEVPLQPLGQISSWGEIASGGTAMRLPRRDSQRIVEILNRRGWSDTFGLDDWDEAGVLISPIRVIEHLIPAAVRTLNQMMAVQLISPTSAETSLGAVAFRGDPTHELFSPRVQQDVLMQFGLDVITLRGARL
ncbi:MAG: hypothetical protein NTX33_04975 [Propionibacteriales bacterium]|nr:hypothetical protein [Propionibacteriales bacterium]